MRFQPDVPFFNEESTISRATILIERFVNDEYNVSDIIEATELIDVCHLDLYHYPDLVPVGRKLQKAMRRRGL